MILWTLSVLVTLLLKTLVDFWDYLFLTQQLFVIVIIYALFRQFFVPKKNFSIFFLQFWGNILCLGSPLTLYFWKGSFFSLFLEPFLNQIFSKESPNWKTSPISGQFPLPNPESRNDEVLVGILITAAISLFTSWAKLEVCQRPKDWASCQDSYYSKGLSLPKMQNCEWLLFKQHQAGL